MYMSEAQLLEIGQTQFAQNLVHDESLESKLEAEQYTHLLNTVNAAREGVAWLENDEPEAEIIFD
ncbi:MAG: hypothetical protein OEZ33_01160 [Gammaproteobacteria bacterium]|nr:hypothetical protein [Gammaproteobacteria bacterium]MDH5776790.1 hypothetical protein [Gammaproteobacteria bacterium]